MGKTDVIRLALTAFAARGHVLLEDVPGTAKTMLARSLAASIDGGVASRIQCTPDLQPTDVTGLSVWDPESRRFEFRAGPVFANVLLVDEINRALPKAQSALLEAMAEGQVTVDGETRGLPQPFFLIATENTIEQEGTFPLPEAQLDRFFLRTSLGYPTLSQEVQILDDQLHGHPLERIQLKYSLCFHTCISFSAANDEILILKEYEDNATSYSINSISHLFSLNIRYPSSTKKIVDEDGYTFATLSHELLTTWSRDINAGLHIWHVPSKTKLTTIKLQVDPKNEWCVLNANYSTYNTVRILFADKTCIKCAEYHLPPQHIIDERPKIAWYKKAASKMDSFIRSLFSKLQGPR